MMTKRWGVATALVWLILSTTLGLQAQEAKKITVEEVYNGTFRTQGLEALRSLNNGQEYTVLNREGRKSRIERYAYEDMRSLGVLVESGTDGIPAFSTYAFSQDESKVLLGSDIRRIYRRSTEGTYHVYDLNTRMLIPVSDRVVQSPHLAPDGSKVAYVFENNLYVFDLKTRETTQITRDGKDREIINGRTDWVYEEEFSFVRAFEWNSEGSRLAFLRFDESEVPEFSMDVYGENLYPYPYTFKYPKAGEKNSEVSLHIHDLASGQSRTIELEQSYYIPRILWMNDPEHLSVQTLNRHQNDLRLYAVHSGTGKVTELIRETDAAYVDVEDDLTFLENDSFIWTSERDGWKHIYLYNRDGSLRNQVTRGPWEVTSYYGYDEKNDRIFYQSTERGSINRDVYSIDVRGRNKQRLSPKEGTNSARFSANYRYFINTHSTAVTPPSYTLHLSRNGKQVREIRNNDSVLERLSGYQWSPKEFGTLEVNGEQLNLYMIKPPNFDASQKYPLLMYQYSGPGSQSVANSWMNSRDLWHQLLASEGYIIACVDGRGTGLKGRDFKKSTYMNLVKYETEDQIEAARILSGWDYIDEERTGIWGWSFGGHMSTNCLFKGADVFELAIAVAPVTSWRFYDTVYTERYLRTPQENPQGYDQDSPFNYPEKLEGKFLLIHGTGDDNVHVQNSMRLIEALIQAGKDFDWRLYPDRNHGIYGGSTRNHLFNTMTQFVLKNL